jgi:DNA processing protein
VLLSLATLTPRRLLELAQRHPTAAECLAAVVAGEAGSESDRRYASTLDPNEVAERVHAVGAALLAVHDPGYPPSLMDLPDPPAGLFVVGPLDPDAPRVAIVGARRCSAVGREVAASLAGALALAGVSTVSGGARGIDAAAHHGALKRGGATIAVLGCGLDVVYPAENRKLLSRMREEGTLVSEYPPRTRAEPFRFPARNRIVAALARAVVVVEGAEGSGSMITADHAMEISRDVFAVPGQVTSPLSYAPHTLIREGAGLLRGPDDLLADLEITSGGGTTNDGVELAPVERAVWDALLAPSTPDGLASAVARSLAEVSVALVSLELRGMVRQAGGRFERRFT